MSNHKGVCRFGRFMGVLLLVVAMQAQQPATQEPKGIGSGAAVPRLIKFSGTLKAPAGPPLTGVHGLTIAIYKDQQGGSPIWMETQNADLDEQGRYTVLLGATKSDGVPLDLFAADEPRWLGVQVQLPGYQEESRVLLVSVPYALKAAEAETLKGLPLSSFVLTPEAAQRLATGGGAGTTNLRTQSVTGLPTAATAGGAGFLGVFTDATNLGNSAMFQSGNSIGLGTITPQALLDVRFPITSFDTVNTLGLFGYSGTSNRSFGFQQIANATTADQYLFFNGGLGSSSTTTAPTLTTPFGYAVGLEAVDGYLSLIYNPTVSVTNGAVNRALTLEASSGRIGVGTTTPQALLDVRKPVTSFDTVNSLALFGYSGTSNRSFGFQQIANATTANQYLFFNGGLGSASTTTAPTLTTPFGFAVGLEAVDGAFNFISNPTLGVTNGAVVRGLTYQASTGRVGIGTTTPAQMLDVAGNINASGNLTTSGTVTATSFTGSGAGLTGIPVLSSQNTFTAAPGSGVGGGPIYVNPATAGAGTTLLGLAVSGTQKFKVDSSGTVTTSSSFDLPATTSVSIGVLNLGGTPILHAFGGALNTFVGIDAGNFAGTNTGTRNTATGFSALNAITTGGNNTATGVGALAANTTGSFNSATGDSALFSNTGGQDNVAAGVNALFQNTTGNNNTAAGVNALFQNTTGNNNTAEGSSALQSNTTGSGNTAVGNTAGYSFFGANANTTGSNNTFIGTYSGPGVASASNLQNATAIGANAVVSASNSLVLGSINGVNNATSSVNVGIGTATPAQALDVVGNIKSSGTVSSAVLSLLPTTASNSGVLYLGISPFLHGFGNGSSTFLGNNAGNFAGSNTGQDNTAVGSLALVFISSGSNNTAMGQAALNKQTTGSNNTAVGTDAGVSTDSNNANTTGSNNTFLGYNSGPGVASASNLQNATAIGANAAVSANNSLVLGSINGVNGATASVNVGIGTPSPITQLEIRQDVPSALGPSLTLMNGSGGAGAGASIDLDGYNPGGNPPSARFQSLDDGNSSSHLAFLTKAPGSQSNSLFERLRITSAGLVGIGTVSPGSAMHLSGSESSINGKASAMEISNVATGGGNWYLRAGATGTGTPAGGFTIANDTGYWIAVTSAGNVGISNVNPTRALDVTGDIRASGCILVNATNLGGTCSSDVRFKKNIQPFPLVLDRLVRLQPVSYDWRDEEFPERHFGTARSIGLIAQEVEQVFPQMVSTDASGYKQVNYSELPYLMLQAIRELKASKDQEVGELKRQVEELRAMVAKMAAERAAGK